MMRFLSTALNGVYIIQIEKHEDERGFFARSFCQNEFQCMQLKNNICQTNISHNRHKGTLRGLHFQVHPYEEAKLITCLTGSIYDVALDIRPDSPTCNQFLSVEMTSESGLSLYIPEGIAHGFLTLQDATTVQYYMYEFYHPENSIGIRWNDPGFNFAWPYEPKIISERDRSYPDWKK